MTDLEALEAAVMTTAPDDAPLLADMLAPPEVEAEAEADVEAEAEGGIAPTPIMGPERFYETIFVPVHLVGSVIVGNASDKDVDLLGPATSPLGNDVSARMHGILAKYEIARRWVLSDGQNLMMDLGVFIAYFGELRTAIATAPPRKKDNGEAIAA